MSLLSLGGCTRGGCRIWGRLAPFGLARAGSAAGAGQCSATKARREYELATSLRGGGWWRSRGFSACVPGPRQSGISVISPGFATRAALAATALPVPALGQRHAGGAVAGAADGGAGGRRRARHAAQAAALRAGGVGGVLDRPCGAVPALGQRSEGGAGGVVADGGAGARRRARHPA